MAHVCKSIWATSLLLVSTAVHAQTSVKYIHTDMLGSVVAVTDASRTVLERREYEPYGPQLTPVRKDGPGYAGHVQDVATGLEYMQQRYYDSEIGIFISVDPVTALSDPVGQFNQYRYANSNPYTFYDPDGMCGTHIKDKVSFSCQGFQFIRPLGEEGSGPRADREFSGSSQRPLQPLFCSGSADCDFMYNQSQFLAGEIDRGEFFDRTQAQGVGGVVGAVSAAAVVSGVAALPVARSVWRNLSFDGPSKGGLHANGRLLGVRWKGGQWGARLDLHPVNSGRTPILHINYGPAGRGEANHIPLFDPRWFRRGGE